ncbi:MAG: protein kinase [Pegethrix bostrychoides GSE-TBD4-15B]|jgi:serine/threonine-protein kinase|uniref:non-specific serine/threonine protein kinase n=1 Tax=Pegethrix bostrychoides GSE-TBD4-15B TaxID=2839662 RepID=A0A951PGT7_9CYAN|nr:protein kinase [Pegethrix bostrychoides GSE-TBD4-15B]
MEIYCTRPGCAKPQNSFPDLDDISKLKTVPQKFCMACGMPLILDNRYISTKLLGRGGFGTAFAARDRRTPNMRHCVIKQFQPTGTLSAAALQTAQRLFNEEAITLERLGNQHPQIPDLLAFFELDVPALAAGQSNQLFYIVQEFVDGQNLEELLAAQGQFSEAEVLEILVEMLKILKFVHENDSIHRDIKPSNIMRRRDGRLFLLDFGAVKKVKTVAQPGGRSTGIYSQGFAPPEQMRGDEVYPSTDFYALAVTCVMLLTGKQPEELYDPYSDTWNWRGYAQVSDRLEAVLNRMLLPTPNQRFATAQDILDALKPSSTPPLSPSLTPTPKPTRLQSGQVASQAQPLPSPAPTPMQPAPRPISQPSPPVYAPAPRFTLLEVLSSAAFTGAEGGLLAIAIASLLGTAGLSPLFWLLLLGGMSSIVYAQSQRWIEKVDLLIIIGVTLLLVWLFPFGLLNKILLLPPLNAIAQALGLTSAIGMILLIAGFACLLAVAATAIFRLIYNLMSRFL